MYTVAAQPLSFSARSARWLPTLVLIVGVMAVPAAAELGGTADTIPADQQHMKGTLRVTAAAGYTTHEIQASTGTTVREFMDSAGKVFAVAWQGPFMPDLRQLLGTYYDQYSQALQSKHVRRTPIVVHESNLVVEAGGHMRSFHGRAYVPQLTPAGVDLTAIK